MFIRKHAGLLQNKIKDMLVASSLMTRGLLQFGYNYPAAFILQQGTGVTQHGPQGQAIHVVQHSTAQACTAQLNCYADRYLLHVQWSAR